MNQATLQWWPLIQETAKRHGIEPTLLLGLVDFESSGDPAIRNKSSGATGLGQVMPRESGASFRDRPTAAQLQDPGTNLEWASRILKSGIDRYGSEDQGLAAYLGSIDSRGNITSAKDANGTDGPKYISTVRSRQRELASVVGTPVEPGDVQRVSTGTGRFEQPDTPIPSPTGRRPASTQVEDIPSPTGRRAPSAAAQAVVQRAEEEFANLRQIAAAEAAKSGGSGVSGEVGIPGMSAGAWLDIARTQVGKPYIWGSGSGAGGRGSGDIDPATGQPRGFDCSGFVSWVIKQSTGIDVPAYTGTAYPATQAVGRNEAQPGDLVFYNMNQGDPRKQHVAIYTGNGRIIQSGGAGDGVNEASVDQMQGAEFRRVTAGTPEQRAMLTNATAAQANAQGQAAGVVAGQPTQEGEAGVSNSAGVPTNQSELTFYQKTLAQWQGKLADAQNRLQQYQNELSGSVGGPQGPAGPAGPLKPSDKRYLELKGQGGKGGLIADTEEEIDAYEKDIVNFGAKLADAQTQAAKTTTSKTPEELNRYKAETKKIEAETRELEAKEKSGGLTPADAATLELRRGELAVRVAEAARADALLPTTIRQGQASADRDAWAVAEGKASLPTSIDRIIAQTNLDVETAKKLRATLPYELDKLDAEIYRLQQLTPIEIQQGKADVELTRQRSNEIGQLIGPRVQQALAAAGVDTANAARITQMLPFDIASAKSEIALRGAQTGLTNAQARKAQVDADIAQRKEKGWNDYVSWAQEHPDATEDQRNSVLMGLVADVQDYATLYRTSLDTSIARSNQLQKTQELQQGQQQADTQQFAASETAQANARQALNQSVANMPSSFGGEANLSGPQGRFAALSAAGAFGGEEAARGLAQASAWGTTELNGVNAGLRAFKDNMDRLRGMGPQQIRQAPTVTAPPQIGVNFTPPGSFRFAGAAASPAAAPAPASEVAPVRQNPEGMDSAESQLMMGSAFVPPGSPLTDEQRRLGLRTIGGV